MSEAQAHSAEDAGHPKVHKYGFWVGVCFTINYVIGVGILELPKAFYTSGVLFGIVMCLISSFLIIMGLIWVVETSARGVGFAAVILGDRIHQGELLKPLSDDGSMHHQAAGDDDVLLKPVEKTLVATLREGLNEPQEVFDSWLDAHEKHMTADISSGFVEQRSSDHQYVHVQGDHPSHAKISFDLEHPRNQQAFSAVGNRLFELNELLDIFAPVWAKIGWELSLAMLLVLACWAYATVFAGAVISKFPIFTWGSDCDTGSTMSDACEWNYKFYILIFGLVVVTLSCRDFSEMMWYQILMTGARFLLIFFLFMTCAVGLGEDSSDNDSSKSHAPYTRDIPTWQWSGIVTILSATLFSQLVDFGAPSILSPLVDKRKGLRVLVTASALTSGFYMLLGTITVAYWGDKLKSSINLNYKDYRGGASPSSSIPWWAYVIQYYCTLFPAIDVLSIYPLLAISLGNSLRALTIRTSPAARAWDSRSGWVKLICRLVASVPPLFGALLQRDLHTIINYTCIPSLWLAFVGPATLQYFSVRKCREYGVDSTTPYTYGIVSGLPGIILIAVFAVVSYILMIMNLADDHIFD